LGAALAQQSTHRNVPGSVWRIQTAISYSSSQNILTEAEPSIRGSSSSRSYKCIREKKSLPVTKPAALIIF
jgi:hypothetical protein